MYQNEASIIDKNGNQHEIIFKSENPIAINDVMTGIASDGKRITGKIVNITLSKLVKY